MTAIAFGYQRYLWKDLYAAAQLNPYFMKMSDENDKKIENGFRLYLNARVGYQFEFFNDRWYVGPSLGVNYWPITSELPADFQLVEEKFTKYSPDINLHFGFNF